MSGQNPQQDSAQFFSVDDFSNMSNGYPLWTEDHGLSDLMDFNFTAPTTNSNARIGQVEHKDTSPTHDNAGPVANLGSSPYPPQIYNSSNPFDGHYPSNHPSLQQNATPANPSSMLNSVQSHNGPAEAKLEGSIASSMVYFGPNEAGLISNAEGEYQQALLDYTGLEQPTNNQASNYRQAGQVIDRPLADELLGHGPSPLYQTNGTQMASRGASGNADHRGRGPVSDSQPFDTGLSSGSTNLAHPTSGSMVHTSRAYPAMPNVARGQPSTANIPSVTADNTCQMYPSPNESIYSGQLKNLTMGTARVTQNPAGLTRPSDYGSQQLRPSPASENYHTHSPEEARSLQGPGYKYSVTNPALDQFQPAGNFRYSGNAPLSNHMYPGRQHFISQSGPRMEPFHQPNIDPMFNTAATRGIGNSKSFANGTPSVMDFSSPHPVQRSLDRSSADQVNRPRDKNSAGTGPGDTRPAQRYGRGNPICADCRNTFKRMPGDDPNKDRCKRHWEAYLKSLKPPPVFIMDPAIPDGEAARNEVFPHADPLEIPDDDWEEQDEDSWVARFITAINRPYLSDPHTENKYGTNQWLLQQQKELNMKPAQDSSVLRGSYTDRAVTARVRLLYMCVRTYHAGGVPPYPVGGDNWGYHDDPRLKCSSRLAEIEQHLSIDKRICMNVIEGRGVHAFAQSPMNYLTRKNANSRSNTKKREYIAVGKNAAAEQAEHPEGPRAAKRTRKNGD